MAINRENKIRLKQRLSKAIGHLNAVYKMVEEEKYCVDVLHQLKAVQSALDRTAELMLKQHLNTCVVEAVQANDSARVMEELWQLLRNGAHADEESAVIFNEISSSPKTLPVSTTSHKCCNEANY